VQTKECKQCKKNKQLIDFIKNKRRTHGRGSYCKPCANEIKRKLRKHPKEIEANRRYREKNKERIRFYLSNWAKENKEYTKEYGRKRRILLKNNPKHKEKIKASQTRYENSEKGKLARIRKIEKYHNELKNNKNYIKRVKKYRLENKEKIKERNRKYNQRKKSDLLYLARRKNACAAYRAKKLKATPSWADLAKIKQAYLDCPKGFHVDHIIPLQGKNVCGFHVENNLQYLPAMDNFRKNNKF